MINYVQVAKQALPSDIPSGTIIKVPVNMITGECVPVHETKDDQTILFYGFIKSSSGWQFLGRGLTL